MSTRRLRVHMPDGSSYEVRVGRGTIARFGESLRVCTDATKALLISDSVVSPLYGQRVREVLEESGFEVSDLCMPAGEENKNVDVARELWDAMSLLGFGRDDVVIALGGGVVGDMSGFVAATYMRGLDFVQVPTTLLSMVDASVGGKNGINTAIGKNLVGTFNQPIYVLDDLDFLATLPDREWTSAFAEIAKSAFLGSEHFYDWFTQNAHLLATHDIEATHDAILRCIEFKAGIVAADEQEQTGVRESLNYGHTLGHAIEALVGYGELTHGQAIAEGMRFAAYIAADAFDLSEDFVADQDILLDMLGLKSLEQLPDPEKLYEKMCSDKKTRDRSVRFVLPSRQGACETVTIPRGILMGYLESYASRKKANDKL
ncbi:MAG: 3-dehydroquinate synthase [Actinobacteria bacterium]|nr:3-dehydroquinate synthase [Actinomycetota bacterium]